MGTTAARSQLVAIDKESALTRGEDTRYPTSDRKSNPNGFRFAKWCAFFSLRLEGCI